MSPGSDYLPGDVNPNLTQKRNRMNIPDRTLEITMNQPKWRTTEQDPFTEDDLERIARACGEHLALLSGGAIDPAECRDEWKLEDGYLVYAPEINTIRIGRGLIEEQTSWWVDVQRSLCPAHGQPSYGWEYQAHFPGIFTADWVNWLYSQWLT